MMSDYINIGCGGSDGDAGGGWYICCGYQETVVMFIDTATVVMTLSVKATVVTL